jgi:PRP38 family
MIYRCKVHTLLALCAAPPLTHAGCVCAQNLVEKIVRSKIYDCQYWKEHCFGLTAESLIDKARPRLRARLPIQLHTLTWRQLNCTAS